MNPLLIQEKGKELEKMALDMEIDYSEFSAMMQENGWKKNNDGSWNWNYTQAERMWKGKHGVILGTNMQPGKL